MKNAVCLFASHSVVYVINVNHQRINDEEKKIVFNELDNDDCISLDEQNNVCVKLY